MTECTASIRRHHHGHRHDDEPDHHQWPEGRRPLSVLLAWLPVYRTQELPPRVRDSCLATPCALCGMAMEPTDLIRRFRCGHAFHVACANEALRSQRQCGSCGSNVEQMEEAHRRGMDRDVGGATRHRLLGFEETEFDLKPERARDDTTAAMAPATMGIAHGSG